MLIMHPTWIVTFKPCKEIPDVALRVSEPNLGAMLSTLRMSGCDNIRFEREPPVPQIPAEEATLTALAESLEATVRLSDEQRAQLEAMKENTR